MTTTPPTPDAAGPVGAVLARERCEDVHANRWDQEHGVNEPCAACLSWGVYLTKRLAPLFAEHGAAERRAGAVSALREAADRWEHGWLRARAAALGDRADEAACPRCGHPLHTAKCLTAAIDGGPCVCPVRESPTGEAVES